MKALDLFCGAGGVSWGLHRAGYEVTGVDLYPQPNYPFVFHQADALDFPLEGYDLICASPPCQAYSALNNANKRDYPELIEPIRERLRASGAVYIIENVVGAPLLEPITLCGTMFGLQVIRHRLFESNVPLSTPTHECKPLPKSRRIDGRNPGDMWRVWGHEVGTARDWGDAMGITWMRKKRELAQAIPPAYSEYLARQVLSR